MCGILGYVRLSEQSPSDLPGALERMLPTLSHRGPDHGAIHTTRQIGLGHRRLSILDPSPAGHQPMQRGSVMVVTNGEIYNFRELAAAHRIDGLTSGTDTEVLAALIDRVGMDATLKQIDGMYAFAAWEQATSTVHLVRDPFGVKPLFVARHRDTLWFASEIKPLLLIPGFERRASKAALHHYLSFDYIPGEHTAFDGIEEVRPGAWWSIDLKTGTVNVRDHRQTDWRTSDSITKTEAVEQSRNLLQRAVDRQLVADVEVGVMLSGGLDSSAIAALTKECRGSGDFHTFSIGFEDTSFDESQHAKVVADHLGTRHHHVAVTADQVAAMLPRYLGSIQEPYADGSAMPTALLAAAARPHVTVLLSGEGGDEFFTGYDTHAAAVARRHYRRVPAWIRRHAVSPLVHRLPVSHRKLSFDFKAKRFVHGAEFSAARAHYAWREVLSEETKRELVTFNATAMNLPDSHSLFSDAWAACDSSHELHRMLYTDRQFHLPDDLMVKNDRMTMAASIETRVPFCDTDLVAYLATIPPRHFMDGLRPKSLLRQAMRPLLPGQILSRKKMGLEMPYSNWIRGEMSDLADSILGEDRVRNTGLLRPEPVRRLLTEHKQMRVDHGRALWGLINFVVWHELFIQTDDFVNTTALDPIE